MVVLESKQRIYVANRTAPNIRSLQRPAIVWGTPRFGFVDDFMVSVGLDSRQFPEQEVPAYARSLFNNRCSAGYSRYYSNTLQSMATFSWSLDAFGKNS